MVFLIVAGLNYQHQYPANLSGYISCVTSSSNEMKKRPEIIMAAALKIEIVSARGSCYRPYQ